MEFFECPICKHAHSSDEWDEKTILYYDFDPNNFIYLQEEIEAWYICPTCEKEVDAVRMTYLGVFENNEQATPLLKIGW